MANKIIGRTDTSGAVSLGSITSNSKRPILLIGQGVDEKKEVIFKINGTKDAIAHFGETSPFVEIVKALVLNGVKVLEGMNIGTVGTSVAGTDEEFGDGDTPSPGTPAVTYDYPTIDKAYAAAYEKSLVDKEIMIIILDTDSADARKDLAVHLKTAENADIYRYAVVGVPKTITDIENVQDMVTKINSDRIFVPFPNLLNTDGELLDGTFTAAALAAVLNTQTDDPALPTNSIAITGFGGVSIQFLESDLKTMADSGICAFFNEDGVATTWQNVTTAQKEKGDFSIWHDATTRLIADNVLATVLAKLKANYRRTKNITRVLDSIRGDIIAILENKLALEIIEEFDEELCTVVKDPEDRYGALADFEYKVVSPLYTITVTQHIKI